MAHDSPHEPREILERWRQRLLQGPWAGLDEELATLQARHPTRPFLEHGLANLRRELALLQARPEPALPQRSAPGPVQQARAEVLRLRLALRAGEADPDRCRSAIQEACRFERGAFLALLLTAEELLRAGHGEDPCALLARGAREAQPPWNDGQRLLARELALDLALASGNPAAFREASGELRACGEGERVLGAVALAALWGAPRPPEEQLARLATRVHEGLPAARRAAACMGQRVALDQLDLRVLSSLRMSWGQPVDKALAGGMLVRQRGPRLLLDEQRGQVLLDGLKTYAPLRDDNRLQVTIGRLRKILGRETILACEDGYRLAGPGALSARLDTNPEVG
jgi:hypothetical protein